MPLLLKSAVTRLIGEVIPIPSTGKALNKSDEVGSVSVKRTGSELPPPGPGLTTVILAVPSLDTYSARTIAFNLLALMNVVTRGFLFQFTIDPDTNPAPLTVSEKSGPPGATAPGTSG